MSDKYINIYGENVITGEVVKEIKTPNRRFELEKILLDSENEETIIVDNSYVGDIFKLITDVTKDEITVEENMIEEVIDTSWYNSKLDIKQWIDADVAKMKMLIITDAIELYESTFSTKLNKSKILTIHRIITNFLRFMERDNIHIEYVINNMLDNEYKAYQTIKIPETNQAEENTAYSISILRNNFKNEELTKIKYKSFIHGIVIYGFIIQENMNIYCRYYPFASKPLLSYGRL